VREVKIIAFTGAGISKESGIDTFQDRPGIREKLTRSYARRHPEKYRKVMKEFAETIKGKLPNDAHKALAEYKIPVITMNVDGLHFSAGSTDIIPLHGRLPADEELEYCEVLYNTPVLYGDEAPEYTRAFDLVDSMKPGDVFLVIGASKYTRVAVDLRRIATMRGAIVIEIQKEASKNVRKCLELLNSGISTDEIKSMKSSYI
jgi:NAD-dependent deacetylase